MHQEKKNKATIEREVNTSTRKVKNAKEKAVRRF